MDSELCVRHEPDADPATLAELAFGDPTPEGVALAGTPARARALGLGLHGAGILGSADDDAFLAWISDRPVGILLARPGRGDLALPWRSLPDLWAAARPHFRLAELPGLGVRVALRWRLDHRAPADALHVAEVQVRAAWRGRGIGSALLAAAEAHARARGYARLSLTTVSHGDARRLFARQGFAVTAEHRSRAYERRTGIPGRVLMEKGLGVPGAGLSRARP